MRSKMIGVALLAGAAATAFAPAAARAQVRPDTAHGRHRPAPVDTARSRRAAPVDSTRAGRRPVPADTAHAAHAGHVPGMRMPADSAAARPRAGMHDAMSGPMHAGMHMDMLMTPRTSAVAESAWTPAASKDWRRFDRLQHLMPRWVKQW